MKKQKIAVLTGAGISAESGLKTFRDADGLWEGHHVEEVATPEGFRKNPDLVLEFYNQRFHQAREAQPNQAHLALKKLEEKYEVVVITQNVDDLHERAGSSNIIHLHGSLNTCRSSANEDMVFEMPEEGLKMGDLCPLNSQLRPNIVWFGEAVPMIERAAAEMSTADIAVIIGTSMQVYPAAGLIDYLPDGHPVYIIDPNADQLPAQKNYTAINEKATLGVQQLLQQLLD
ncbi:SIR2 family NAD-dependent protein deacylase [Persicobacter psychrovividus]|uniref:protein acetyllysine N-acetyltransferase n=1 Tax=Persicobacter psychrovividus TaxID=387638 RepID=A0ABN6LD65_9BACT|nr:NAD-dependent protein deacylase [Persicobacter psychrovividus]